LSADGTLWIPDEATGQLYRANLINSTMRRPSVGRP
jgi:hypothetical protein